MRSKYARQIRKGILLARSHFRQGYAPLGWDEPLTDLSQKAYDYEMYRSIFRSLGASLGRIESGIEKAELRWGKID